MMTELLIIHRTSSANRQTLQLSGQLNVETYCMAFRNVYTFGPTFRAENSNTTRHAAEFWMIEPEIAFADLKDDMELAEDMLKYIINYCLENAPEEMQFFNQFIDKELLDRLNHVVNSEFAHVTYTEAVNILIEDQKPVRLSLTIRWNGAAIYRQNTKDTLQNRYLSVRCL